MTKTEVLLKAFISVQYAESKRIRKFMDKKGRYIVSVNTLGYRDTVVKTYHKDLTESPAHAAMVYVTAKFEYGMSYSGEIEKAFRVAVIDSDTWEIYHYWFEGYTAPLRYTATQVSYDTREHDTYLDRNTIEYLRKKDCED